MSIGYRSLLYADPGQSLVDVLIEQLNGWMASKSLPVDAGHPGRYQLDYGNVVTVIDEGYSDGRLFRWTRNHPAAHPREVLRSTITAFDRPHSAGWVWSEIEAQDDREPSSSAYFVSMSVPRVLRTLLGTLSLRDGRTDVGAEPMWVSSSHLPDVMDYLADDTRIGGVYVANQGPAPKEDFEPWVTEVSWHLAGVGTVLMLGGDAAIEFNEMVGERHVVPAGTMRTYLPNVDLDDPDDPLRHRILGAARIHTTEPRRLAGMLGMAARIRIAQLPVPPDVADCEKVLQAWEHAADPTSRRATLQAVPAAEYPTDSQILSRLGELQQEIDTLRAALTKRSSNGHRSNGYRQMSAS